MTQLKVGIIGTGIFARDRHLPSYQELSDNFKVILNDSDVDFIDALLPVQFNVDIVEKAVKAGKPVLLEKPIAANLKQAKEIVKLADSTPIPIGVAENWLYLPCVKTAKEQIKKISPVIAFTHNSTGPFVTDNKYLATTWRQKPEHIGGIYLTVEQVREASGADDIVFATVQLKDADVIGSFTYGSAFGATEKSTFLKVYGKNGTVTIDLSDKRNPVVKVRLGGSAEDNSDEQILKIENDESFGVNSEFLNFHEAVSKKNKSLYLGTPRVVFHHLACVDAFLKSSAKNGDNVKVEQP
ncbi:CPG_1a_G0043800.mRNA.1.CDS.1 [Saccharomyces cerevisiae]|nr:CPG_1a_G0043800.mRNA.1.CDS.1 [Saccharomyces cerevisiae]CAI7436359.1 CPG_1a_G0043800.mRNA.1.CDS.1 [Saccharomyces cerevisiae]